MNTSAITLTILSILVSASYSSTAVFLPTMGPAEACMFLETLINKTLHVTVVDGRLFTGTFKCTDNESNIILSNAFEYRAPTAAVEAKAMAEVASTGQPVRANMTSRYVGLIVVPGLQISKLELEQNRPVPLVTTDNGSPTKTAPALTIRTKP